MEKERAVHITEPPHEKLLVATRDYTVAQVSDWDESEVQCSVVYFCICPSCVCTYHIDCIDTTYIVQQTVHTYIRMYVAELLC